MRRLLHSRRPFQIFSFGQDWLPVHAKLFAYTTPTMSIVMLRILAQGLLGLTALALLLWHGFLGAGWIAAFVYAGVLAFLANLIAPTPDELSAWREFCAQDEKK